MKASDIHIEPWEDAVVVRYRIDRELKEMRRLKPQKMIQATAPMNYGEKIVMRILDKQKSTLPLAELGFSAHNLGVYRDKIKTPYGMVLHVGSTGSGKSMTAEKLKRVAVENGMITLFWDGLEKVLNGVSSLEELLARVKPDEFDCRPFWWSERFNLS